MTQELGSPAETITGRLGVGAVCFLAAFLAVDGMQIGVFGLVEKFGGSVTVGIVALPPTVVVTYVLGVFCVGAADLALSRFAAFREPELEKILALSTHGGDLLKYRYLEVIRNFELLKGLSVAFMLLALGTLLDAPNMPGQGIVIALSFVGAICLSFISLVFSRRAVVMARRIANMSFAGCS